MDDDLLQREMTYYRKNAHIEKISRELVKEMESRIDDELEDLKKEEELTTAKTTGSISESHIRFLQAKVKSMRDSLNSLRDEYGKRTEQCKSVQDDLKKALEESSQTQLSLNAARETLKKKEKLTVTLTDKLKISDAENATLKKELTALKRELKQKTAEASNVESKLNRVLGESERIKESAKNAEKENREKLSADIARREETEKALNEVGKQKCELLDALKKQSALIANLKKQKALLECSLLADIAADQFLKLLDSAGNAE
ncbi:immune-associated nucleotide-binding protein 13 isoform X1 [Nilaparvata lugens]|uniref:immune-associated nucleotide-binding protein 13 isoform X1 n=2 Tax=Nilaparvata lugens TaxID=108931 RepID=UPI00193E08B1|nr:immune-associated nucleotide-binding protein 13 isoform X1 [Nilaparvata lugens]